MRAIDHVQGIARARIVRVPASCELLAWAGPPVLTGDQVPDGSPITDEPLGLNVVRPGGGLPQKGRRPGRWPRAIWSGLLSLVMPGLGQVHARSWQLGVTLLGIATAANVAQHMLSWFRPEPPIMAVYFALLAAIVLLGLGAAVDAVRRTRRSLQFVRPPWFGSTWFAAVVMLSLNGAVSAGLPEGWQSFSIPAGSMIPTVLVGDRVVVYARSTPAMPAYGDVVVFKYPRDNTIYYIKRIVGLPGDRVQVKQGQLYINGDLVPRQPAGDCVTGNSAIHMVLRRYQETLPGGMKDYILKATDEGEMNNTPQYLLPPDNVLVLGDNRDNSADSRFMNGVGFVPIENLVGRAEILFFSVDAEYPWWEVWEWPFEIRWSRLMRPIH